MVPATIAKEEEQGSGRAKSFYHKNQKTLIVWTLRGDPKIREELGGDLVQHATQSKAPL